MKNFRVGFLIMGLILLTISCDKKIDYCWECEQVKITSKFNTVQKNLRKIMYLSFFFLSQPTTTF